MSFEDFVRKTLTGDLIIYRELFLELEDDLTVKELREAIQAELEKREEW